MKKTNVIIILLLAISSVSHSSSISLSDIADLDLPMIGPAGGVKQVCYLHDDAFSIMPFGSTCDVNLISQADQNRLLSTFNKSLIAGVVITNHDPGDHDCYTQQRLGSAYPNW